MKITYFIFLVQNVYDGKLDYLPRRLVAEKRATAYYDNAKIFCPTAVEPGTFFNCHISLMDEELIRVEYFDIISEKSVNHTDWIRVPSRF